MKATRAGAARTPRRRASATTRTRGAVPHEEGSELLGGFIRMHILHHAAQGPVYGLWVIEELRRHGYSLSPGTLYPILHGMERQGYVRSRPEREGRSVRRVYSVTAKGRRVLAKLKIQLKELLGEIVEHDGSAGSGIALGT